MLTLIFLTILSTKMSAGDVVVLILNQVLVATVLGGLVLAYLGLVVFKKNF